MGKAKPTSRRSVLKKSGAIAGGPAVGSVPSSSPGTAQRQTQTGFTCGDVYASGERFTVEECPPVHACDSACAPRNLSPACEGNEDRENVYRALRNHPDCLGIYVPSGSAVSDGLYEVVDTRVCETGASECEDEALYVVTFRPLDG